MALTSGHVVLVLCLKMNTGAELGESHISSKPQKTMTLKTTGNEAKVIPVHPFFEYDLNGNNYDQNITIFYPKLRLKYD